MLKVTVFAHQSVMDDLVGRMQRAGVLDIESHTADLPSLALAADDQRLRALDEALADATFVRDFPEDTSPLVRAHRSKPGMVEKWDLYVDGFELATGYSELVDPVVQRERLVAQSSLADRGDHEAMRLDEDFLGALEQGMPPTGGVGLGIDRLLMALTGLGIRETILFPLVKPEHR